MADSRDRSASPTREPKSKKQKTSGFKWKEKKSAADDSAQQDGKGLERGYRERDTNDKRRRDRDREDRNDKEEAQRPSRGDDRQRDNTTTTTEPSNETPTTTRPSSDVANKFGSKAIARSSSQPKPSTSTTTSTSTPTTTSTTTTTKRSKPPPPPSNEPMIIVNVNDRLGTKAAIPCLASDSIKNFKAMVAAHIGRQPHEIMLKRQGERPFKDQLSLEDYGVSSGVQLDLEIDTGD